MTATRIYLVRDDIHTDEYLVRAVNQAAALRHVTQKQYSVSVATQEQIVALLTQGARVNDAKFDDPNQPLETIEPAAHPTSAGLTA